MNNIIIKSAQNNRMVNNVVSKVSLVGSYWQASFARRKVRVACQTYTALVGGLAPPFPTTPLHRLFTKYPLLSTPIQHRFVVRESCWVTFNYNSFNSLN